MYEKMDRKNKDCTKIVHFLLRKVAGVETQISFKFKRYALLEIHVINLKGVTLTFE